MHLPSGRFGEIGCRSLALGTQTSSKPQDQARSLFRLGGCREHGSIIGFQELEPMRDVARMMVEMRNRQTKLGTQDRGGQLGHQFFGR